MAEEKEEKSVVEANSPQHHLAQDSEKLRLRAKENLEKAKQVLAESGKQLMKNKQSEPQTHFQEKLGNEKNEKEDSNEHA